MAVAASAAVEVGRSAVPDLHAAPSAGGGGRSSPSTAAHDFVFPSSILLFRNNLLADALLSTMTRSSQFHIWINCILHLFAF